MKINLAEWCIKHKQVVYFFIGLIAITGIYCFNALGRSEDPNFVIRQMVISCAWPGASADEMQKHVTDKIEKLVQGTNDIDYITSYSRPGTCVVNVILREQVPNAKVRNHWLEVRNYIQDNISDLPNGVYGPYFNDRFDDVFGNIYALTSDSFSYEEMRVEAEELKRRFYTVKDVRKVELIGVQPQKIYIQMSNTKMSQMGLSLDTVTAAIAGETSVSPSGKAEINGDNVYLRLTGLSSTLDNVRNILIKGNGRTLRLGDIAQVTQEYPDPPEPKMYVNGMPAIGIAISMEEGGNNITLGKNLDKMIASMEKNLPLGFKLNQVANQPKVVENAIGEFTEGLYEAIIIVLAVSLLTLGRRSGYVISACIPLVLMGSIIGMYILGIDLHKVSLGSLIISLGMLVDDAIVVVELMEVKMSEGWDNDRAATYAFETCGQTLLFGTMITCCSFMPIALSHCNVSEFAGSLFPVISITLMFSWFVSATVAPTLGHSWIHPAVIESETYDTEFYRIFRKTLNWSLGHRKTIVMATLGCFILSVFLLTTVKKQFFPESVRPEVLVELNLPESSGIEQSDATAKKLMSLLADDPNIDHLSAYVGKSAPRFVLVLNPVLPRDNYVQLVVVAKDAEKRIALERKINRLIKQDLPEVIGFSQSVPLGPPSPYPVMFRVSAPTDALTREYAFKVREIMSQHPDITMTIFDWMEKAPALKVSIDNDKLKQMGLTRKSVATALQASLSGYSFAQYYETDQNREIVFRLDKADRNNIEELSNLPIPTASGAVPLSQLATISYQSEDNMIWRRNLLPTITISADIGDDVTGNDVSDQVWNSMKDLRKDLPPGVQIEIGGPAENSSKTLRYLLNPMPIMALAMLILMMLQMQDLRKIFIVICTAPLCIIGISLGLLIFNAPMGVMAQVGSFAIIGTVIRNSMVIIDQVKLHEEQGMDIRTAIIESAIVRYRPILLAALTTILGLIPMFINPFWQSMAIAMSGGLTGATALTLIFLPTLYAIVFKIPEPPKQ